MKTPSISLQPSAAHQLKFHDTRGTSRELEVRGDGQVESPLLDSLARDGSVPKESFLASLDDKRLLSSDPYTDLAKSGWRNDYRTGRPDGFVMVLKSPDGPHKQILTLDNTAGGGRSISLSTVADGIEHDLSGDIANGKLKSETVKESVVLDASSAGLPVYQDGAILFDLPSAFTGGCTI